MKNLHRLGALALFLVPLPSALLAQSNARYFGTGEQLITDPMAPARDAMARGDPAEALARYLRVLARDPSDLDALSGAGAAALAVGDADAAINFFVRAEKIAPRDGRIKAGLGSALLQKEQPRPALRLFDSAVNLGVPPHEVALDRGLAYDLRGDNKRAQTEYQNLLRVRPDPEATRRLALSLAMTGDQAGALAVLDPLLRKQDVAAWRARAFVYAMTGDTAGAESTANAVLPRHQAAALRPFLGRLAALRPSQKAAAVHFGHFPEDKVPQQLAAASRQPQAVRPTPPARPVAPAPARPLTATPAPTTATATISTPTPAQLPTAKAGSVPVMAAAPASEVARPDQRAEDARSLAEDRRAAQKRAAAERAAAEKKAKERAEARAEKAEPTRHWVQIASGSYKPDLGKEWSKQKDRYGKLLTGKSPWTTPFRSTNRLLVGPFADADAAQAFVNDAKKKGLSAFRVTTASGQKVERID